MNHLSVLRERNDCDNRGNVIRDAMHRFNPMENKENINPEQMEGSLDEVFEMLREDLILRNKVDLKVCCECRLLIGRKRPRVMVEYVEELVIKACPRRKRRLLFSTKK